MKIGFTRCEAFNGQDEDKEEHREDRKAFGCSSLHEYQTYCSPNTGQSKRFFMHTTTPWSAANIASSYNLVTRSQRAVI